MSPLIFEKIQSSFKNPFFLIFNRPEGLVYFGEANRCVVDEIPHLQANDFAAGYIPYDFGNSESSRAKFIVCNKVGIFPVEEFTFAFKPSSFQLNFEDFTASLTRADYLASLQKIKEHLQQGDCYQVNLSQKFECQLPKNFSAFEYFIYLNSKHPAPYASFLDFGEKQVLSFSPELFLKKTGCNLETRPIKGTQKRSSNFQEDELLKQGLQNSAKERAELLMIVDLERNDFGKICEVGSVKVSKLYEVETYDYVHHLQATVEGILKKNITFKQVLSACFPGGSVTGAPKKKAMEIIRQLEKHSRAVYTGALGWMDASGDFLFNLPIRTLEIEENKASFCVGGGIVIDSDLESEYEETLLKSKVFF